MQPGDLFEYVAAFVTIVLAIALTDMVQSTHKLLRARSRVKWDALTPLFALWIFLWVLLEFFSLWLDARYDRLTYFGLVGLMVVPTFTALAAYAVLPDDVPDEGLDLERFYYENRAYLLALLALINAGEILRMVIYAYRFDGFDEFEPWMPWISLWLGTFAVLALLYFVRIRWVQYVGLLLLFYRIAFILMGGQMEIRAT